MKKLFIVILSVLLLFSRVTTAVEPENLLPQVEKWNLTFDSMVYTPDNLWELINGAADVYLIYQFRDLHIGEYTNENNTTIRVELYRHMNPDNTFGIYTIERMPDYDFFDIGVEGYTSFGVLNFLAGNFYVKMVWSGSETADEIIMKEIAKKVENHLNQQSNWPGELKYFPETNKIVRSEGYSSENFMGYSFFNSAFTVGYAVDNKQFKMFILRQKNMDQAKSTLERYFKITKYDYSTVEEQEYLVDDPYNGKVGVGIKGNLIYGITDTDDIQLINKSLAELKEKIIL